MEQGSSVEETALARGLQGEGGPGRECPCLAHVPGPALQPVLARHTAEQGRLLRRPREPVCAAAPVSERLPGRWVICREERLDTVASQVLWTQE